MTAGDGASARAEALDIAATRVDGNEVFAVHAAARRLVAEVRAGDGPRLLHALTYRVKGHVSVDPAAYRDPAELAAALETDPIAHARARLLAEGVDAAVLDAIAQAAQAEVEAAVAAADAAPWPDAASAFTDVQDTGAGQWT
jgi:pyruvate dehydrogenase E1 component alpha subunit